MKLTRHRHRQRSTSKVIEEREMRTGAQAWEGVNGYGATVSTCTIHGEHTEHHEVTYTVEEVLQIVRQAMDMDSSYAAVRDMQQRIRQAVNK